MPVAIAADTLGAWSRVLAIAGPAVPELGPHPRYTIALSLVEPRTGSTQGGTVLKLVGYGLKDGEGAEVCSQIRVQNQVCPPQHPGPF